MIRLRASCFRWKNGLPRPFCFVFLRALEKFIYTFIYRYVTKLIGKGDRGGSIDVGGVGRGRA